MRYFAHFMHIYSNNMHILEKNVIYSFQMAHFVVKYLRIRMS